MEGRGSSCLGMHARCSYTSTGITADAEVLDEPRGRRATTRTVGSSPGTTGRGPQSWQRLGLRRGSSETLETATCDWLMEEVDGADKPTAPTTGIKPSPKKTPRIGREGTCIYSHAR